jgi:putative PIN family toxin of toxin-antitoxin system
VRIVLDTNVVISALLWSGTPYSLIQAAVDGWLTLCTTPVLLSELHEVLQRPHLASRAKAHIGTIDEAIALYGRLALTMSPTVVPAAVLADPDDNQVIAAALAANAAAIVTGDRHLLDLQRHGGIHILTSAQAVRILLS